MISTLDQINSLQKQLQSLLPMKPEDQQRLDKKFRLEFNYNSNHLEGNTLTYGETELLLIFGETNGSHSKRELDEMEAHDVAYHLIEDWAKDNERPLTEQSIKELNEIILVRPYWKDAMTTEGQATRRQIKVGDYKEHPNSVRLQNGEMFHYASPTETPIKMQELIDWYRQEEGVHPVEMAALLHYKFVCIHPFDDGNGRVSRLLMNYVLLRNNLPPIIIKSEDKTNYLRALHLADIGDEAAFTEYIAQQVIWSLQISIKSAKGESIDEPGDFDKRLKLLKKELGDSSERVIKYSIEEIDKLVNAWFGDFLENWELALQKLDSFFLSRKMMVTINYIHHSTGENLVSTFFENYNENLLIEREIKKIRITCNFIGLRNSELLGINSSINGGEFEIEFHQNAYEIKCVEMDVPLRKLYGENVSTSDTNFLVEYLGNWVIRIIEKNIKR